MMIHLDKLQRNMVVKGIIANNAVEILDLQWKSGDQLIVTCQDSRKRLHVVTLNPSHESYLECINNAASPSSVSHSDGQTPAGASLLPGMYVRVPLDLDELDGEFRDYRIGQIVTINSVANQAWISLQTYSPGQPAVLETVARDIAQLHRCHIMPETPFIHTRSQQEGLVLLPCEESWQEGRLCEYYVQLGGQIQRLSEELLLVPSHRQSPNPAEQLMRYELHHPRWKFERDQLIESYAQLRTATFGLEDLVGSRVMLLPHQAEVIATVLSDETCRYVLADEVGLGKTIEACVILKGLCRRFPGLTTLIIAPASLVEQWHYELNSKFWLDFTYGSQLNPLSLSLDKRGIIVSVEKLLADSKLANYLVKQRWGLLIIDEAHHLHKRAALYKYVHRLSTNAERALILSATPIQRRADEYLGLLKLMDPVRYGAFDRARFAHILESQQTIRQTIAYLARALNLEEFDIVEFVEEMGTVAEELKHDRLLQKLIRETAGQPTASQQLANAKQTIRYVSENYRVESRVIRNRRINLNIELPQRAITTEFSYLPEGVEVELLSELYDYIDYISIEQPGEQQTLLALEYGRILLHKAFSSPQTLGDLLKNRQQFLESPPVGTRKQSTRFLLTPAAPREENKRIQALLAHIPSPPGESNRLKSLLWLCQNWQEHTEKTLEACSFGMTIPDSNHRLVQVLRSVQDQLRRHPAAKVIIFSAWAETLQFLLPHLTKHVRPFRGRVAQFHGRVPIAQLQEQVDLFQSQEEYCVLVCDELGGEGRNFQMADVIIHLDIPWTPAQLEQRIGRVDRLGRTGKVLSIVPYAREQVEYDLFRIWEEGFNLFTRSMSGLEIALEGVLDDLLIALRHGSRDGLANLIPQMVEKAKELRETVEEERYFEENAINHRRRDEFQHLSEQYRDGSKLRLSITRWASMAGLKNTYNRQADTVVFFPEDFGSKSMANAKFFTPPNMEEALSRSGRSHNLVITGTFNRDIAVRREDLVFFAPGNDPWTDSIVGNALEADRGRSCAILRKTDLLTTPWRGVELFYQLQVNPRPLYEAGHSPIHLFQAQGYLFTSTLRLLISTEGDVVSRSHPAWQAITAHSFNQSRGDRHLGKRGGQRQIDFLKEALPADIWVAVLERAIAVANAKIEEEFAFAEDVAQEAAEEFEHKLLGLRATQYWLNRSYSQRNAAATMNLEVQKQISDTLTKGIRAPLIQLESACFWWLHPLSDHESIL
jgi:ATP-dependent helicase HepA